jgi:hypothetical protein
LPDSALAYFHVLPSVGRYILAGDFVHHLFLGDYAKAFPEAKVIGVDGLGEKRKDVKFNGGESSRCHAR